MTSTALDLRMSSEALCACMQRHLALHCPRNAISLGNIALSNDPNCDTARHLLGIAYFMDGQYAATAQTLAQADSHRPASVYLRARALLALQQLPQAEECILAAVGMAGYAASFVVAQLRIEPGDDCPALPGGAGGLLALATAAHHSARTADAITYYKAALKADPTMWHAYEALATLGAAAVPESVFGNAAAMAVPALAGHGPAVQVGTAAGLTADLRDADTPAPHSAAGRRLRFMDSAGEAGGTSTPGSAPPRSIAPAPRRLQFDASNNSSKLSMEGMSAHPTPVRAPVATPSPSASLAAAFAAVAASQALPSPISPALRLSRAAHRLPESRDARGSARPSHTPAAATPPAPHVHAGPPKLPPRTGILTGRDSDSAGIAGRRRERARVLHSTQHTDHSQRHGEAVRARLSFGASQQSTPASAGEQAPAMQPSHTAASSQAPSGADPQALVSPASLLAMQHLLCAFAHVLLAGEQRDCRGVLRMLDGERPAGRHVLPAAVRTSAWAMRAKGRALLDLHRCSEAAEAFSAAARLAPWCVQDYDKWAAALWHGQRTADLTALAMRVTAQHATAWQAWAVAATAASSAGQTATAIAHARDAVKQGPCEPATHTILGHELLASGDLQAAERAFQRALSWSPRAVAAWFGRGSVAMQRQDWPAAIQYFQQAVALHSQSSPAAQQLGLAYSSAGQHELAARSLAQAATLDPSNVSARYALAQSQVALQQLDAARASLQSLLAQPAAARAPAVWLLLGHVAAEQGDGVSALKYLQRTQSLIHEDDTSLALSVKKAVDALVASGKHLGSMP